MTTKSEAQKRHADYYLNTTEDRLQRKHAERNAAPVPSEQVEVRHFQDLPKGSVFKFVSTIEGKPYGKTFRKEDGLSIVETISGKHRQASSLFSPVYLITDSAPSEQEVTPEHSPLPWEVFHFDRDGADEWMARTTHGTGPVTALANTNDAGQGRADMELIVEAVNSHAELKERVHVLETHLDFMLSAFVLSGDGTAHTEEFWEHRADSAMEEGKTSEDIRSEVWYAARAALQKDTK